MQKSGPWLLILLWIGGCISSPIVKNIPPDRMKSEGAVVYGPEVAMSVVGRLPDHERLTYEVRWLGLSIGTLTTSIKGREHINGREAYVLEAIAKTNAFFSKIHKIDSRFISFLDVEKLYPVRFEVHRRDAGHREDSVTEFDQFNHKAYYKNRLNKSEKSFDIAAGVQDILSACYYLTLVPLAVGDKVEYDIYENESNHHFFCLVPSKALIRLPVLGKTGREAYLMRPYARLADHRTDNGKVSTYYSCDVRRIPLVARVKCPVFTEATIILTGIENQ